MSTTVLPTGYESSNIDFNGLFGSGNPFGATPTPVAEPPVLVANAGNSSEEQMGSNTVRFVGVRDPQNPGSYLGQVAVQWNARDGTYTAYGLWGAGYQLPQGTTTQQIASGTYGALQLYPMPGAGASKGWDSVAMLKQALGELQAGRLSAAEMNRVEYWGRGVISNAYGADRANWDAGALNNFHEVTGQISRTERDIAQRGEQAVERLSDTLSLSNATTRQAVNNSLAAARSEYRTYGTLWSTETRERYAEVEPRAAARLRSSAATVETPIGNDGVTRSYTVPNPSFVNSSNQPYSPVTTDSQGRQWLSSDELAHYLRNTGTLVTSGWLIANNPARAHKLGNDYQFRVGDTIRVPEATGTAASTGNAGAATSVPGTTIRMLPGYGATVIGASNGIAGGGAFLLVPNQGVADAVLNADPSQLWDKGLSQASLFVTSSGAVTQLLTSLGVPTTSPVYAQVARLGPNAVATYKFADGSLEVGAGGSNVVAGGNALVFWNGRAELANQNGLFPNGVRASVNGGVLGNVGSWASRAFSNVGTGLAGSPEPRTRAVGAFLKGIGDGSAALGTATKTNFWIGGAARADLTTNGSGPLRVLDPSGQQIIGPEASFGPGYLNFGDTYLARANIQDQMYSGTRVWRVAETEMRAAQASGGTPNSHDIPALALAYRVNQVLWDHGALPRGEFVTTTAEAALRLQRLHDGYLSRMADADGNLIAANAGFADKANQVVGALVNNSGVNLGWDTLDRANQRAFSANSMDFRSAETRYFFNPEGGYRPRRTVPGGLDDRV